MVKANAIAAAERVDAFGANVAFVFDQTGVTLARRPTFAEWADTMDRMKQAHDGLQFWVGDLILLGEAEFGERAAQVLDHTQWAEDSIRVYRWAAAKVPPENRRPGLSFKHHVAVATMTLSQQRVWLDKAIEGSDDGSWTADRLVAEIARAGAKPVELVFLLVVDCGSEARRMELSVDLHRRGYLTKTKEQARRAVKAVTAKAKRGRKPATRRRG